MTEVRIAAPALLRAYEALAPAAPAELFRPYVWRDPSRLSGAERAALFAADEAEGVCSCCGGPWWMCGIHK